MMTDITYNNSDIKKLLKNKNNLFGKIQTKMTLNAYTKKELTEEQIQSFQNFYKDYEQKSDRINDTLSEIEQSLALNDAKKEILNDSTDYAAIYDALKEITDRQQDAIINLNNIIEHGEKTLAFI